MELMLQRQYNLIYAFFKTTTEPFDDLDWDGTTLLIYYEDEVSEEYSFDDLKPFILNL